MKHIKINSVGAIIGMYLDEPEGSQLAPGESSVALSDEDWQSVGPGYRYIGGKLVPPEPVVPAPPSAPRVVTMRQARLALLQAGKLTAVNQTLAALTGVQGEAARIEWEFAASVGRGSELVTMLSAALSLSDDDLEALFTTAAAL